MSTVKHDYILGGKSVTPNRFIAAFFDQHTPAEAGRCIRNMQYGTICAYCEHGSNIHNDPSISEIRLDPFWENALMHYSYTGAYFLEIEDEFDETHEVFRYFVFFILIPSNADQTFAFFDVKCA